MTTAKDIAIGIITNGTYDDSAKTRKTQLNACSTKAQVLQVLLTHRPPFANSQIDEIMSGT
jgi:hypothetical protein